MFVEKLLLTENLIWKSTNERLLKNKIVARKIPTPKS